MTFSDELGSLDISSLTRRYRTGNLSPAQAVEAIFERIEMRGADGIWTYLLPKEKVLRRVSDLEHIAPVARRNLPLWGIPFSVKDCIDIAGIPTTCACPSFKYIPANTNPAVMQLLEAGAILIGKTNLDQFATGLVGIRTGYDVPYNPFVEDYITGGSSSGAAPSVATGLVSFAIGSDTGGSGRIPAGFNNVVGLKPTRGLLSTNHMVDACKTIDCVSIFALTVADAWKVMQVAKGYDPENPFSRREANPPVGFDTYQEGKRFRFGVPAKEHREFFGNRDVEDLFTQAIETFIDIGGTCIEIDYKPFIEVNNLLFNGPWVAERYASVGSFIEANPQEVHPIVRDIILAAKMLTAVEVFEGQYHLATLQKAIRPVWEQIDVLIVPTAGTAYRITEIESSPLRLNANLGYYTNFVNLLDLAAIAIPNGFQQNGMPSGVTLIGLPYTEPYLTGLGSAFHCRRVDKLGATPFGFPSAT